MPVANEEWAWLHRQVGCSYAHSLPFWMVKRFTQGTTGSGFHTTTRPARSR